MNSIGHLVAGIPSGRMAFISEIASIRKLWPAVCFPLAPTFGGGGVQGPLDMALKKLTKLSLVQV